MAITGVTAAPKTCDAEATTLQQNYVTALGSVATYELDGNKLTLRNAQGATQATFNRADLITSDGSWRSVGRQLLGRSGVGGDGPGDAVGREAGVDGVHDPPGAVVDAGVGGVEGHVDAEPRPVRCWCPRHPGG